MFRQLQILLLFALLPAMAWAQKSPLEKVVKNNDALAKVVNDYGKYQAQIIYTQIDRDKHNKPSFKSYSIGLDEQLYYYPASMVKMPTAFLALQKLNELDVEGLEKDTSLKIGATRFPQTAVAVDTSALGSLPSLAHYVRKVFLVSDNDAFNRLYEFVGQEYVNKELERLGYANTRISHRLVGGYDGCENSYSNPFWFYNKDGVIYEQPPQKSNADFSRFANLKKNVRGKGYIASNGKMVNKAFDFSNKNFIALQDLHDIVKAVLFPESLPKEKQFNLTQDDYAFLYKAMSQLPKESISPAYNVADNYVKFFLYGDKGEDFKIPDHIKIFNKVGFAYGFLTDVSYIVDEKNGVEFMLAATLHLSENEIYNDGVYEYESVGIPFLAELGREIYNLELQRKRKHCPDLSKYFNKENNKE